MAVRKKVTTKRKAVKRASTSKKANTRVKVKRVAAKSKAKKSTRTAAKAKPRAKAKPKAKATRKPASLGRISAPYTKSELFKTISERTELQKKDIAAVVDELAIIIAGHLGKGGPGQFNLAGLLKMTVKKTPAKKARKGINPFTGEPTIFKAKPASRKVKILALKKLKEMVA